LNPNITSSTSGTYIITFTDNVCNNSTTANITQIVPPSIFDDGIGCFQSYAVTNTVSFNGGVWTSADTSIIFYNPTDENPLIWTSTPGQTYTVTFTDNFCNMSVSADIYYPPYAFTGVIDKVICVGSSYTIYAQESWTVDNYVWSTGATGQSITVTQPGDYIVTGSNICHSFTDTATIGTKVCEIEAPNVIVLSSQVGNNAFFVQYEGVAEFNCVILNRWGNTIYEFDDPAGKWDGKTEG